MKLTEQNFIQQMMLGNEKALEYVMIHYGGLVKSVIHRYLYPLSQFEEECASDVFYAVWEHCASFQPEKNPFSNWIAGIARIKALDYKRKYARRLLETGLDMELNADGTSDLVKLIQEEFSEETKQMLSCLKPQDQELFCKLYVDEMTIDEISAESGISKPVIYNRLSRARKKINRMFPRGGKSDRNSDKNKEGKSYEE
ncbi:MAG: sigma-70 family RNA polymerase sigma factor [Lachnospiraceae bacterium]|nr:sigma-70 family RNA polymerase sigma factor [Lachnospiraceae bacterium]